MRKNLADLLKYLILIRLVRFTFDNNSKVLRNALYICLNAMTAMSCFAFIKSSVGSIGRDS